MESHQEGLLNSLRAAEIEVAITYDLQISEDINFLPLATLPPYALFGASHPLARERAVKLSQLAPLPMVLLDMPMSREYFLALFFKRAARTQYRVVVGTSSTWCEPWSRTGSATRWPMCGRAPMWLSTAGACFGFL